jgi:two-component system, sensor histidine kinase and response regulator
MAQSIITGFLNDIPEQIAILKSAVEAGDSNLAQQQAHRIKSAAGNIGGLNLQRVAHAVESAGQAHAMGHLYELLPQLEDQFVCLKHAMEQA